MKRYEHSDVTNEINGRKHREQQWRNEHRAGGFKCAHCKQFVIINDVMGTANRNHCNLCLWSKHVDIDKGDRRATCHGGMRPVGLTFKHEGFSRTGEIMLIHLCSCCPKISINRIARDDPEDDILTIFTQSLMLDDGLKGQLKKQEIYLLNQADHDELHIQLFGKEL